MKLTTFQKFKLICNRYNIYYEVDCKIDYILMKNILKIYEKHKDIDFELFIRNFYHNQLEYIFELSEKMEKDFQEIHLLNNCFHDKDQKHFGLKYKGKWFFLTHRGSDYGLPLNLVDFKLKNKDQIGLTYLVSYSGVNPNILSYNCGQIRTNKLGEYINKFLC